MSGTTWYVITPAEKGEEEALPAGRKQPVPLHSDLHADALENRTTLMIMCYLSFPPHLASLCRNSLLKFERIRAQQASKPEHGRCAFVPYIGMYFFYVCTFRPRHAKSGRVRLLPCVRWLLHHLRASTQKKRTSMRGADDDHCDL